MPVALQDNKRQGIAFQLANMKAIQKQIIANEEKLSTAISDADIRDRLNKMLDDDRKNLGVLETTTIQYGNQADPEERTQKMLEQTQQLMEASEASLYEKIMKHELLKHSQVTAGLIMHKAAQVVGADVEAALTPIHTVNFENRSHQEQLKGILEVVGTRELTGLDPDQGVWARVQDGLAALTGVFGSAASRTKDDMNVLEMIYQDHRKAETLFTEIENNTDPVKQEEFFGQLFKDLTAHAEAEEEVVYPAIKPHLEQNVTHLERDQSQMKDLLQDIKSSSAHSPDFLPKIKELKKMVKDHTNNEENNMMSEIRRQMSEDEMQQLAKRFKEAKSKIQQKLVS